MCATPQVESQSIRRQERHEQEAGIIDADLGWEI
jgi:hypothetical protein